MNPSPVLASPGTEAATPATLAKAALRRLAASRLEPTPANFANAYAEEAGQPAPGSAAPTEAERWPPRAKALIERLAARATDDLELRAELASAVVNARYDELQRGLDRAAEAAVASSNGLAALIEKLARGLERGSKQWTLARKKDSLQRVLESSRSDAQRLQQRLRQLTTSWDDMAADDAESQSLELAPSEPVGVAAGQAADSRATEAHQAPGASRSPDDALAPIEPQVSEDLQPQVIASLDRSLRAGLPRDEPRGLALADELSALAGRIRSEGATREIADWVATTCLRAEALFEHRHHLVDELLALCRSLSSGLTELAEDASWAQGQSDQLRQHLDEAASARAVRAARDMLELTRRQQREMLAERERARDALKSMVRQMVSELAELGQVTGRFSAHIEHSAVAIVQADSIDGLADVVQALLGETRAVQGQVTAAHQRMAAEQARANELEACVRALEADLRRLSDEVATDALTQVANRRGMLAAFEIERARLDREGSTLAVGLIDIDNFKRLNDSLGHAVGDVALKALAARVKDSLRPMDHVARFGGEEFVVLLPQTSPAEAQQVLTRLQRELTAGLFMHEGHDVLVTFSAGVTAYRSGEALEQALERADEGLYEAKRSGKNRSCVT